MIKGLRLRKIWMAGLLLGSALFLSGCAGGSQTGTEGSTSDFTLPGESVIEANTTAETGDNTSVGGSSEEPVTEASTVDMTTAPSSEEPQSRIVVLDPGHGGAYTGANYQGFMEKDLALKVARYVKTYLETNYQGAAVYLTRNEDKGFSNNATEDLKQRVSIASQMGAELLVSIHFNSDGSTHSSTGALVCASKQPWVSEASRDLANSILEQLEALGIANRGILLRDSEEYFDEYGNPMDYYAICRHSASAGMPGIIVEHCFMDNPAELPFFGTEEALQKLAMADAIGIANYMGLEAK